MKSTTDDSNIFARVEKLVLAVHHRNGGALQNLDFDLPFLDKSLHLDSLDLAELMVAVERDFQCNPFAAPPTPRTWRDIINLIQLVKQEGGTP